MAWTPISGTVPQYEDGNGNPYSGAVLKAYSAGTTTNINMATDSTGSTTASSIALNASGYPVVSASIVVPHLNEKYKLSLYPTQAAADSDTGAIWTQDNMSVSGDFGSITQEISTNTTLDSSDANNHLEISGSVTITLPDIDTVGAGFVFTYRNAGTGVITLDGNGSEQINGSLTLTSRPGEGGLVQSAVTTSNYWSVIANDIPMATVAVTSASNATTINCQLGDVFSHTFTENTTFTFSNPFATGTFTGFVLYLTNDGTGRTPTWPASVDWEGGVEPDFSAASEKNVVVFTTIDGGTTWYGSVAVRASS